MTPTDELVKLIEAVVEKKINASTLKIKSIVSAGDLGLSSMGDIRIQPGNGRKVYSDGVEIGFGIGGGKIWLNSAHTAWMIMNGNTLEFHIPGGKWRVVSE